MQDSFIVSPALMPRDTCGKTELWVIDDICVALWFGSSRYISTLTLLPFWVKV